MIFKVVMAISLCAMAFADNSAESNFFVTNERSISNKKSIAICSMYTPDISEYGKIAEKINQQYALRHGYTFIVKKDNLSERSPVWDKVLIVKNCLEQKNSLGDPKFQYVFWIDADAIFNKQEIPLEKFLDEKYDFIVCHDVGDSLINTGTFMIKNSPWAKDFTSFWWRCGDSSPWAYQWPAEQHQLALMYHGDLLGLKTKALIQPSNTFNSDPNLVSHDKRRPGWDDTFVIHLMGGSHQERVKTFQLLKKRLDLL